MSKDAPFNPPKSPPARPGPPGGRRERNRQERTRVLCEAALPLFLERGVTQTSIEDITRAAGVAKGSFYRYFDDKGSLVETLVGPLARPVLRALDDALTRIDAARTPEELNAAYEGLGAAALPLLFTDAPLMQLFLQERLSAPHPERAAIASFSDEITERAIAMTEAAKRQGLLAPVDARISARVVLGAIYELLLAQLSGHDLGDPTQVATSLVQIVMDGVRSSPANEA